MTFLAVGPSLKKFIYLCLVTFPFLDGDFPRTTLVWSMYTSTYSFVRFASQVNDFNNCNRILAAMLTQKVTDIINLVKLLSQKVTADTADW